MKSLYSKQPEIAEIPDKWILANVEDFAELRKESCSPNGENESPYIGLEHINQDSLSLNGVGNSSEVISNKYRFYSGDILFGKLRPYFRKVYHPNFDGVCSTDIWVLKPKNQNNADFLFYFTANQDFVNMTSSGSTGTKMPRANWDQIKNSQWAIPQPDEQQQIASILSSLDDKIELNRKMNKTLEEMGKALFKRWFVDFEFPDENGKPYKSSGGEMVESELGMMPKGWKILSLDEIADFLNGLACQKYPPIDDEDALPVIKIADLRGGFTSNSDYASSLVDEKYHIQNGDVLFSWSGSLEICLWPYGEGILNQHLFKVSSPDYPKWFYYYWTLEHLENFRVIAASKATTMGHIQRRHLSDAKVLIPESALLEKISSSFESILNKQISNNKEIAHLSELRDSLLPRLMSGKLRVKN